MNIKLRFVNLSKDGNKSEVVIYQRNLLASTGSLAVAWKVIRNCGRDCYHPFVHPMGCEVSVADENGNFSPRMNAENGQLLKLVSAPTVVRRLLRAGSSSASNALKVLNDLDKGAVNVCVLRDGRPVDIKTTVTPQQKAVFEFKPTIWIGVA